MAQQQLLNRVRDDGPPRWRGFGVLAHINVVARASWCLPLPDLKEGCSHGKHSGVALRSEGGLRRHCLWRSGDGCAFLKPMHCASLAMGAQREGPRVALAAPRSPGQDACEVRNLTRRALDPGLLGARRSDRVQARDRERFMRVPTLLDLTKSYIHANRHLLGALLTAGGAWMPREKAPLPRHVRGGASACHCLNTDSTHYI